MLETVLTSVLQRRLGQFIEIEDGRKTKLNIWGGSISLRSVRLRPDALYTLGLPLSVRSGLVEELSVEIPWRRLGKDPVIIKVSGVSIVCGALDEDDHFDDATLRAWAWRRKQLELQELLARDGLEDAALDEPEAEASGTSPRTRARHSGGKRRRQRTGLLGFLFSTKKLASKVLDHLKVELDRLHIRYEDDGHSDRPFALGISLDAMATSKCAPGRYVTSDAARTRHPVDAHQLRGIARISHRPHRSCARACMLGVDCVLMPDHAPTQSFVPRAWHSELPSTDGAMAKQVTVSGLTVYHTKRPGDAASPPQEGPKDRTAMIGPAQLLVRLQYPPLQPSVAAPAAQAISIAVRVDDLGVRLEQAQLIDVSRRMLRACLC